MKIGITCYPTYGGSGVIATELGLEMARRGHEVHFISYASPIRLREFRENVYYHEVEVSEYPLFKFPPHDIALASRMAEVMTRVGLDILHVHYAIPHSICALLARQIVGDDSARIITTLHGTDITLVGVERSYSTITQFGIQKSDRVTAVSGYLRDETYRIFGDTQPVDVIHNFVDTDKFKHEPCPKVRAQFANEDERLVVHVSNMRPVKRIMDVIHAFDRIHREVPSRLLMIGDGPERSEAESLAAELGIAERVQFLGNQQGVPNLLCAADVFLLPSEFETFGLAALEAMACETPVIVTEIGGTGELVADGETGFLVPVGDVEAIASRALDILRDDDRRARMSKAARRRVLDLFNRDKIVDQYERYYQDVLE